MSVVLLFFLHSDIYFIVIYHILFFHLPVDGYLGCLFHCRDLVNKAINVCYNSLHKNVFSLLLSQYLETGLLTYMVRIHLTLEEIAKPFSKVVVPFCFPTSNE